MAFRIKIKDEELLKNYHPGIAIDKNLWSTNSETIFLHTQCNCLYGSWILVQFTASF